MTPSPLMAYLTAITARLDHQGFVPASLEERDEETRMLVRMLRHLEEAVRHEIDVTRDGTTRELLTQARAELNRLATEGEGR